LIMTAIILFGRHCYLAYKVRIRKNVDEQMKTSLLSVAQMILPIVTLILLLAILPVDIFPNMAILYGFCIFFGWLTAIIIGMTFKTLPFIIWNKVYHTKAYTGKTPAPKELFSEQIYNIMLYAYLAGFILFCVGIIILNTIVLKLGAIALVVSAVLYVVNIGKALSHKPKIS
ncbi:MAG TPA: cytochrome C oxidase subunit I, partial [Chitinophagales bacterium]|nr:cytochrome C oxidase subunit I [Chitinophagales bacterium]